MMHTRYSLLLIVCAACSADAADSPERPEPNSTKVSYGRSNIGGWQASATGQQSEDSGFAQNGQVALRVYEGFNTYGPVFGHRDPARAIDVTAQMETCPDGNTRIRAMNIGGWLYQVSGDCGDYDRGSDVTVTWGNGASVTTTELGERGDHPRDKIIRCDPKTWNCRTVTR